MNNHELIKKYSKLVMERLYNQDVQVFFFIASFSFQSEQHSWLPLTLTKLPARQKQLLR